MQILLGMSPRVDLLMVHIPKFVLIGQKVAEQIFEQILIQLLVLLPQGALLTPGYLDLSVLIHYSKVLHLIARVGGTE